MRWRYSCELTLPIQVLHLQYTNITDRTDKQDRRTVRWHRANRFWPTVCKTIHPIFIGPLSCLSVCLSVTLVYCGRMAGWIKMKLGMRVGLSPGHIVLDGNPALPPPKWHTPNFWPISVVAKWLDGLRCHFVGR